MQNNLSKPFYNRSSYYYSNDIIDEKEENPDNPYEIAKKRQSASDTNQKPLTSPFNNNSTVEIPHYTIGSVKKKAQHRIKLVVVGDGGSGKTCLLISYSQGEFPTTYIPTIFENYVTDINIPNSKESIQLTLWDTAGQEEYDRLRPLSYPDVNILLICYAVNNMISLNNVKEKWAPEVQHFCPGIPIILVGTKIDLQSGESVSYQQGEEIKRDIGAVYHIRCSAKTTENINNVFDVAINTAFQNLVASENKIDKKSKRRSIFKPFGNNQDFTKDVQVQNEQNGRYFDDYHKNSEYDFSDIKPVKIEKKFIRKSRCIIL
ncbi:hypothetical protein WICMUC_000857 [Wickerhamomyces mucosus]|uniref:GTP-binding protein RHO4 n=1 Tax=Wickerhamomyces mucosus TaxID=1378264 RepID=A0A9P8TI91_9ASCO|nr:hypothetical protein WICMUC_000857 [Wickerhamomyces mucosus]